MLLLKLWEINCDWLYGYGCTYGCSGFCLFFKEQTTLQFTSWFFFLFEASEELPEVNKCLKCGITVPFATKASLANAGLCERAFSYGLVTTQWHLKAKSPAPCKPVLSLLVVLHMKSPSWDQAVSRITFPYPKLEGLFLLHALSYLQTLIRASVKLSGNNPWVSSLARSYDVYTFWHVLFDCLWKTLM